YRTIDAVSHPVLEWSRDLQRAAWPPAPSHAPPAVRHRPGGTRRVAGAHDCGGRIAGPCALRAQDDAGLLRDGLDSDDQPAACGVGGDSLAGSGGTRSMVITGASSR